MLLILACVNLGGLLLARLGARSAELAVRLALGGTRWRIAQQMLVESGLLSMAGALLALPTAYFTAVTLASFMPPINGLHARSRSFPARRCSRPPGNRPHGRTPDERLTNLVCRAPRKAAAAIRWDRTIAGATGW